MPRWETPEDLRREKIVACGIADQYGMKARKCPPNAPVDYALEGGGITSFIEIKVRKNASTLYPTLLVDLSKYNNLIELNLRYDKCEFYLVVCWTDRTGYFPIPCEHTVKRGGRYDRNDPNDIEQVAHFDTSLATTLYRGGLIDDHDAVALIDAS